MAGVISGTAVSFFGGGGGDGNPPIGTSFPQQPAPPAPPTTYDDDVRALLPSGYWATNELSGPTAIEEVSGNDGVYEGSILYQDPGLVVGGNKGIKFNNADDNLFNDINIPANTLWDLSSGGSLVIWFRRNSDEFFNFLMSQWDANDGLLNGWVLDCRNTGGGGPGYLHFSTRNIPTAVDVLIGNTAVNNDARHMAGVTIDGSGNTILYVDGLADASGLITLPGPRTNSILTFGADWEPINTKMWIAKPTIWGGVTPTILTPANMAALYAKGIA